jgi:hypothetical protein
MKENRDAWETLARGEYGCDREMRLLCHVHLCDKSQQDSMRSATMQSRRSASTARTTSPGSRKDHGQL